MGAYHQVSPRATLVAMKRALLLVFSVFVLSGLACEAPVPTATPTPTPPSASYIVESAIENLREQSSFHVTAGIEGGWVFTRLRAEIVPPDRGRIYEHWFYGLGEQRREFLVIEGSHYYRPPGFQVWFDSAERPWFLREIQGFPYDLAVLRDEVRALALRGSEVIEGVNAYRLTGTATKKLDDDMGFYMAPWSGRGMSEVEMWISRDDLLPLRIEALYEEINSFPRTFSAVYSDFGVEVDVSVPKDVLDIGYLDRLEQRTLSPEELGRLVNVFPTEGQKCVEAEIGRELYREVLSGDSDADIVFKIVVDFCARSIFSSSSDLIPARITEALYWQDLSVLSIPPEEMVEEVVECLREGIGLESLFEIGWDERAPTPDELEAAERCKAVGEG